MKKEKDKIEIIFLKSLQDMKKTPKNLQGPTSG
jgi:hypothetical protein